VPLLLVAIGRSVVKTIAICNADWRFALATSFQKQASIMAGRLQSGLTTMDPLSINRLPALAVVQKLPTLRACTLPIGAAYGKEIEDKKTASIITL
jgi:hypothetical protein